MSEYDAFGRKKGEDPLAGLGGQSVEHASSSPAPPPGAPVPPPYAPQVPGPIATPSAPPRRGGAGWVVLFIAMVLTAIAGAAALVVFSVESGGDGVSAGPSESTPPPVATAEEAPAEDGAAAPARGLRRGSLVRRGQLTKALQTLRAAELGGIVLLRVAPERINVQVKTRDGRLRNVTITPDGLDKGTASGPGFGHIKTFATREVNPAAPERLLRSAARRLERSTDEVDYLVLIDVGGPLWGVFFKDGTQFQGDAAGRITRRVN